MTLQVELSEELMSELKNRAAQEGTSEAQLVAVHLKQWLSPPITSDEEVMALTRQIIQEDRPLLERLA